MSTLTPITYQERIVELDLLRGFALFGIILVNVPYIGLPFFKALTDLHPFTDPASTAARSLINIFFEGKFITLFSFLFGLGFSIFATRARAKGHSAGPLYLRRLFILGLLGAAHATLFWAGDILLPYAVFGLLLLIFLNRTDKTVKIWALLFPLFQILLFLFIVLAVQAGLNQPDVREEILASFDEVRHEMETMAIAAHHAYSASSWSAMIPVRLNELVFVYQGFIMGGIGFFYLLGIFLAGYLAGRNNWFDNIKTKLPKIKWALPWLLLWGLLCAVTGHFLMQKADILVPDWSLAGYLILFVIGTPALTASYAILLLLGYHRWKSLRLWSYLGAAGQMSLTIYLTQTLILTTIFYGYGLGLLGKVPVNGMLLIALLVFAGQLLAAGWWMKRFRMGPFEWMWRAATYGKIAALKRHHSDQE